MGSVNVMFLAKSLDKNMPASNKIGLPRSPLGPTWLGPLKAVSYRKSTETQILRAVVATPPLV